MNLRVFVYGTLMPGQRRWPALSPFVASWVPATARGTLWDTGLGYPAASFGAQSGDIPGVVATVAERSSAGVLRRLDAIEAEGVLYRRVEILTSHGPAFSYEWLGETVGLTPLPRGWPPAPHRRPWPLGTARVFLPGWSPLCRDAPD